MTALKMQLRSIVDHHGILETIRMLSIIANDMHNPRIFTALDKAYGGLTAHGPSRISGPKKCGHVVISSYEDNSITCTRTRADGCGFMDCPNKDAQGNPLAIDR